MGDKRGQIAIFVIIAIVVVGAVGVYFFIAKPGNLKIAEGKPDSPIYSYAEECIESAIYDSVEIFGLQQGYFDVPESNSLDTDFYRVAYYYLEGYQELDLNMKFPTDMSSQGLLIKVSSDCQFGGSAVNPPALP